MRYNGSMGKTRKAVVYVKECSQCPHFSGEAMSSIQRCGITGRTLHTTEKHSYRAVYEIPDDCPLPISNDTPVKGMLVRDKSTGNLKRTRHGREWLARQNQLRIKGL